MGMKGFSAGRNRDTGIARSCGAVILSFALLLGRAAVGPGVWAASGDVVWTQFFDGTTSQTANGAAVGSDGLYIVGNDFGAANIQYRFEKRNLATGALIWSAVSNPSTYSNDNVFDVAVGADGFYTAGQVGWWSTDYDARFEKRSLTDGSLIWGQVIIDDYDKAAGTGVAVGSDGVYIVGWNKASSANSYWLIDKRSLVNGTVMWSQPSDPTTSGDRANDVAVGTDGVYIVGYEYVAGGARWRIEKRSLTTGALTWAQTGGAGTYSIANGVAVGSDGIYVVGYDNAPGHNQWRIEKRALTNGALTWAQSSDPSTSASASKVIVTATGITVFGTTAGATTDWRLERRRLTDGALIWAKDADSGATDYAMAVALGADGFYTVGYDNVPGHARWRIEKRSPRCTGPAAIGWTDATITAGATPVRATHFSELRTNIDARRSDGDLLACVWTDPALTPGTTPIRKLHVEELRSCVSEVYTYCGSGAPSFTDPALTLSTPIRKVHVDELRTKTADAP